MGRTEDWNFGSTDMSIRGPDREERPPRPPTGGAGRSVSHSPFSFSRSHYCTAPSILPAPGPQVRQRGRTHRGGGPNPSFSLGQPAKPPFLLPHDSPPDAAAAGEMLRFRSCILLTRLISSPTASPSQGSSLRRLLAASSSPAAATATAPSPASYRSSGVNSTPAPPRDPCAGSRSGVDPLSPETLTPRFLCYL